MKKEVIMILRSLRADTDVHAEVENLRWAEVHGNAVDWASWHEALQIVEQRQEELASKEVEARLRNVARAHRIVNEGALSKDAQVRVLTRACAALRDEYHNGYTGWRNLDDLKSALYAAAADVSDSSTWPDWIWSLWYDITPEWSRHSDHGGAHAALRAAVEMLFPFDSNETEEEPGGMESFHKGRRW